MDEYSSSLWQTGGSGPEAAALAICETVSLDRIPAALVQSVQQAIVATEDDLLRCRVRCDTQLVDTPVGLPISQLERELAPHCGPPLGV